MSGSPAPKQIHVDLWPAGAWTAGDLAKFKALLGEVGRVSGRRSSTARGQGLQTTLYFAAAVGSAVMAGFLARLGEDIYESFRAKLGRLLKATKGSRRKNRTARGEANSFTVVVEGASPNAPSVSYVCEYFDDQDLAVFFESLEALHSMLSNSRLNGLRSAKEVLEVSAYLCTELGRQRFATMRAEWFCRAEPESSQLPTPPYWTLDVIRKDRGRWRTFVTVVPARSAAKTTRSTGSIRAIKWKRVQEAG